MKINAFMVFIIVFFLLLAPTFEIIRKVPIVIKQSNQDGVWINRAKIAWKYFAPGKGVVINTGLHQGTKWWHYFTEWDLGNYIIAIIAADKLGIIDDSVWTADYRIEKILGFLENRELNDDPNYQVPYLVYDAYNGSPGWKTDPNIAKKTTNPSDAGRLLIALKKLKEYKPNLANRIDNIVLRNNYAYVAEQTSEWGEGFYRYYIAQGFAAFNIYTAKVNESLKEMERLDEEVNSGTYVEVYGERLPTSWITTEPIVLGIMELNLDGIFKKYAQRVYNALEKRYKVVGMYQAWSEGQYDDFEGIGARYLYEWIVTPPNSIWVIMQQGTPGPINIPPVIYTKTVFALDAIYRTNYTNNMVKYILSIPGVIAPDDWGFIEGVSENGRVLEDVITAATNAFIIESALHVSSYSLVDLPFPFIDGSSRLRASFIVGASWPHGRNNFGASTTDVVGSVFVALKFGGASSSTNIVNYHDSDVVGYDPSTGRMWIGDTYHPNLVSFGGPGVNMLFDYYNDKLLAKFTSIGGWHIVTPTKEYWKEVDNHGRTVKDYGIIALYYDESRDSYVLLVGGIGAEGTIAASKVLSDGIPISGRAVVVEVSDGNGDSYITFWNIIHNEEKIEIKEIIP
jgi:hypothetical protein